MLTLPLLSVWVVFVVGVGRVAQSTIVGLIVFLFAWPLTTVTLVEHQDSPPLAARLTAQARTLTTVAVAAAAGTTLIAGTSGIGYIMLMSMRLEDIPGMFRAFGMIVLLALMVDILLGILQLFLSGDAKQVQRV